MTHSELSGEDTVRGFYAGRDLLGFVGTQLVVTPVGGWLFDAESRALIREMLALHASVAAVAELAWRTIDFGRVIGKSDVVETDESEEGILYAPISVSQGICLRMLRGVQMHDTTKVTFRLDPVPQWPDVLELAFFFGEGLPEPTSAHAQSSVENWQMSCEFWRCHARQLYTHSGVTQFTREEFFGREPAVR
ncbi:MAG: hypothetical protein IT290_10415 [Deltaproteobacteria bacterium]|nr:hypothetical protein [Deltaproteobacteria bacterium]